MTQTLSHMHYETAKKDTEIGGRSSGLGAHGNYRSELLDHAIWSHLLIMLPDHVASLCFLILVPDPVTKSGQPALSTQRLNPLHSVSLIDRLLIMLLDRAARSH